MQTAEKEVYSGAFGVVRKTIRKEGLRRGLYAGVSAPLIGVTPIFAVSFWGYDVGKGLVERFGKVNYKNKTPQYSIGQVSGAGFFSAIPMTLINAPFERVKIMLQLQGQKELKPGEKPKYNQRWSECGESAIQGGRYPICLPRLQSAEGRPTIELEGWDKGVLPWVRACIGKSVTRER